MLGQLRFTIPWIVVVTLGLSACGSADDENSITGAFNKSFDESWNTEFVAGCVTESQKAGATEAAATPICNCLVEELGKTLDGISEKMNPPQAKLEAATEICLGNL